MDNNMILGGGADSAMTLRQPPLAEWTAPRTREEADETIINLSHDIGLILAQLAEDEQCWCARTGRSGADYAAWRRRALFAKVHKEGQLRECKRVRARLAATHVPHAGGPFSLDDRGSLLILCRRVLDAWLDEAFPSGSDRLDNALAALAENVEKLSSPMAQRTVELMGGRHASGVQAAAEAD